MSIQSKPYYTIKFHVSSNPNPLVTYHLPFSTESANILHEIQLATKAILVKHNLLSPD